MIKFDTINGTLCRMLEKPIPLCASIKYPYVISGKKTKHPSIVTQDMDALLRIFIIAYSDEFEVIGYPVADHSAEWALYQMQQGDVVCQKYNFKRHYKNGHVHWFDRDGIERRLTTDLFLKNFANTIDWQIYTEPKPLLAEAKEGDLCQRRDGKWVQVDSYFNDSPCPIICKSDIGGQDCFTLDGRNHNAVNDSKDIIHTEPLATIGSAEWAWQQMLLGNSVKFPSKSCDNPSWSMQNGIAISAGLIAKSKAEWLENATPAGWHLYEPKIEPCPTCNGTGKVEKQEQEHPAINGYNRYDYIPVKGIKQPKPTHLAVQVGDWVECVAKQGQRKLVDYLGGMGCYKTNYGEVISPCEILRKLSPAKVVVTIGCLSGTVVAAKNSDFFWLSNINNPLLCATIPFAMLDTSTAALVLELLEKQEGE